MSKRRSILMLLPAVAVVASVAAAEDSAPVEPGPWKFGSTTALNLSQSAFSNNWSGGDRGAVVWVLNGDATADRQFSKTFNLSNHLQLAYGQTAKQVPDTLSPGELKWDAPDKTTDLILFESTGRFTLDSYVDPYFALRLDSQFRDQSNPIGEIAFNPVKLKESAGIARVLLKTDDSEALTRLGFGLRQTFASSIVDAATKKKASYTSNDGGFEWQTSVTRPVLEKKVLYKAQLLVFKPLFYSKSGALEDFDRAARDTLPQREAVSDFWKAIDINFQNAFSAAITKYLSVDLYVQWVYDKFDAAANVDRSLPLATQIAEIDRNVRKRGQFKETLSLGLTYRLF